jgi:hypothetical protein
MRGPPRVSGRQLRKVKGMSMSDTRNQPVEPSAFPSVASARAGKSRLVLRKADFFEALADPKVQATLARARKIDDTFGSQPRDARQLSS